MYFATWLVPSTWLYFLCFCDLNAGDDPLAQASVDAFLPRERTLSVSVPMKKKSLSEYQAEFVALFDGYCNCPILGAEDTECSLRRFVGEFLLNYSHEELDNITSDIYNHNIEHAGALEKFTQWINKFSKK
jgi:hypothetical protein